MCALRGEDRCSRRGDATLGGPHAVRRSAEQLRVPLARPRHLLARVLRVGEAVGHRAVGQALAGAIAVDQQRQDRVVVGRAGQLDLSRVGQSPVLGDDRRQGALLGGVHHLFVLLAEAAAPRQELGQCRILLAERKAGPGQVEEDLEVAQVGGRKRPGGPRQLGRRQLGLFGPAFLQELPVARPGTHLGLPGDHEEVSQHELALGRREVLGAALRQVEEMGLSFMFSGIVDQSTPEIRRAVNELCAHQVCGILLYLPLRIDLRDLQDVCRNVPIVAVDSNLGYKCPAIFINQELGSRIATQHLIRLGHKKIAYLQGPLFWRAAELRFKGWVKELKSAGLSPGPVMIGNWTAESGFEATQKLIAQNWGEYSALVVANDQMALGAIRAFEENGIQIPRDLSVVGFDDIPEAAFFRPPLSTIKQDFATLASSSVECLMSQLNQQPASRSRTIRPILVGRESTATPGNRKTRGSFYRKREQSDR